MTKKQFFGWVAVLAVVGGAAAGWFYAHGEASGTGGTHFKTVKIGRGDIVQTVTANGALGAVQTVEVGSEVSGKIVELFADYNSVVTNGQLLARLDDSGYLRQLEQSEAERDSAKASLKLAQTNFKRAEELREAELVSQADYDASEATLAQAKATLRMREASLNKVKVDLEKTWIYSPMDGVVISRAVDAGQTVAAGMTTPVLFTLAKDLRKMQIEAAISEADVGGVAEGQKVMFTVDAFPDRTFTGRVKQVRFAPVITQNVVNYIAIVEVDNAELKLRPGMTANASVVTAERRDVLRLPNAALRFRPGPETAVTETEGARPSSAAESQGGRMVVVQEEGGGLRRVWVPLGITDGSWTEILGGLQEGNAAVTGTMTAAEKDADAKMAGGTRSPFMPGPPRR